LRYFFFSFLNRPASSKSREIQVGGFANGKSYATDVAEMVARSQAAAHVSHQRGAHHQSNYAHHSISPGAGVTHGPWLQDDDWHAGARAPAEHQQQFPLPHQMQPREPQHSHHQSDRVSSLVQSPYSHQPSSVRHGVSHDADVSIDPRLGQGKKDWELQVEQLRLAKQRQQVQGTAPLSVLIAVTFLTSSIAGSIPFTFLCS
jgi:hypothetical protein